MKHDQTMKFQMDVEAANQCSDMAFIDMKSDKAICSFSRIISLWDMLQFEANNLLSALTYLGGTVGELKIASRLVDERIARINKPLEQKAHTIKSIETLQETAARFEMKTSERMAKQAYDIAFNILAANRPFLPGETSQLSSTLEGLINAFVAEASERKFFALPNGSSDYLDNADALFGEGVIDAFPDTEFDICEAGKCRTFGLWTASVMHLMRVLEIGLKALANHLGVEHKDNWNQTLNLIEASLRQINKRTDGPEEEQWSAEAGTHLRFVKNAWRNHAMHPRSVYDQARTTTIFDNTRSFMQHLANKLSS